MNYHYSVSSTEFKLLFHFLCSQKGHKNNPNRLQVKIRSKILIHYEQLLEFYIKLSSLLKNIRDYIHFVIKPKKLQKASLLTIKKWPRMTFHTNNILQGIEDEKAIFNVRTIGQRRQYKRQFLLKDSITSSLHVFS